MLAPATPRTKPTKVNTGRLPSAVSISQPNPRQTTSSAASVNPKPSRVDRSGPPFGRLTEDQPQQTAGACPALSLMGAPHSPGTACTSSNQHSDLSNAVDGLPDRAFPLVGTRLTLSQRKERTRRTPHPGHQRFLASIDGVWRSPQARRITPHITIANP